MALRTLGLKVQYIETRPVPPTQKERESESNGRRVQGKTRIDDKRGRHNRRTYIRRSMRRRKATYGLPAEGEGSKSPPLGSVVDLCFVAGGRVQ